MSDLAGCYAAIAARPDGQAPRATLIADTEPRYRSANSAQTVNDSLVIGVIELANSRPNRLGAIYG
jgi:hypothetical protein